MSAIMAFLVFTLAHIPVIVVEKNAGKLDSPVLQIIGGVDFKHPIIKLTSDQPNAEFEVEYLLSGADVPIFSRSVDGMLEKVPDLAPCRVRVRAKVEQLVSIWSRPVEIPLVENDPIFGLQAKDGY